jgi:hypothetical protein
MGEGDPSPKPRHLRSGCSVAPQRARGKRLIQGAIGEADRDLAVRYDRDTDQSLVDSPLERSGFELVVPRCDLNAQPNLRFCPPRSKAARNRKFADSPLEATGSEPSVPRGGKGLSRYSP